MRRALAAVALVSTWACSDPELHVTFSVPGRYRTLVTSSTLRIMEPPPMEPFGCDDVAFSRRSTDVFRLSTVLEVTARSSESVPLADLDRLSSKLLVANGLDDAGEALVAGCVAVGEVDAVLDATIEGEPIAVVTPPSVTATAAPGQQTKPVVFDVRDRKGQVLSGVEAVWQVTGAGGDGEGGDAVSDEAGRLTLRPHAPEQAGPFFVSLSARWATTARAIVSGAATPTRETIMVDGRALAYRAGRIGPNGEPGLVVLTADGTGAANTAVFIYREGGNYVQRRSPSLRTANLLAVLEELRDPPTSGRDKVVALDGKDWIDVLPDGTLDRRTITPPGLGFGNAEVSVSATECRVGAPARLLIGFTDGFMGVYGATGQPLADHFSFRLNPVSLQLQPLASGCLDVEGTGPVRTYVMSPGSLPLYVITERTVQDIVVGGLIALTSGLGFVPPSKANVGLLLGTQIDGNDLVLARSRGRVMGSGDDEHLELVSEGTDLIPTAFTPVGTAAGDLDLDGRLDVVSLFGGSTGGITLDTFQVWSYLALEVGGRRISGPLVDKLPGIDDPELLLIDLDRDTVPDVIVGARPATGGQTRIEVFRLGG